MTYKYYIHFTSDCGAMNVWDHLLMRNSITFDLIATQHSTASKNVSISCNCDDNIFDLQKILPDSFPMIWLAMVIDKDHNLIKLFPSKAKDCGMKYLYARFKQDTLDLLDFFITHDGDNGQDIKHDIQSAAERMIDEEFVEETYEKYFRNTQTYANKVKIMHNNDVSDDENESGTEYNINSGTEYNINRRKSQLNHNHNTCRQRQNTISSTKDNPLELIYCRAYDRKYFENRIIVDGCCPSISSANDYKKFYCLSHVKVVI